MLQPKMIALPPWELQGNGYILLYHFPKHFIENNCFLTDFQRDKSWLGLGSVMLVDYNISNVGGYKELLFMPSLFDFGGAKAFNISKIYVSTYDSVYNGIENWGIPKELADFQIDTVEKSTKCFRLSIQEKEFFKIQLKSGGISFPITTSLFPFTFYHSLRGKTLITNPHGQGWAKLCKIQDLQIDSHFFPDISQFKPLLAIEVSNFTMKFPIPKER